jgi:alkylation response protein AidB-like acyl-CoA dehydrogenase
MLSGMNGTHGADERSAFGAIVAPMEPYDSPQEATFRAEARTFLQTFARPIPEDSVAASAIVAEWTPEEEAARLKEAKDWQKVKFDNGWAGITWPKQFGGRGGSLIEHMIFRQEESLFDVPHDALAVGLGWCGPAVLQHGDTAQHERLLPPLLRGDEVWCQLYSEPGAGSDLAGLATRAVQDGEEWVVSGQKVWTTFAHHSDWGLCIARHDPAATKHTGLSAFLVDMKSPGIEVRPLRQMTDSSNFNEVFLDEVRVPAENLIGQVGDGWRVVITTFMWERVNLLAGGERILRGLRKLIHQQGSQDDPVIRERYAAIYARAESLRFNVLRLMTTISRGGVPGPEGSIMKLLATTLLTDIYEFAVDLQGPAGMLGTRAATWNGEWQSGFLGMPGLRIGGGTDQVQRNIIGERVLNLPPDIRVDKGLPFAEVPKGV